MEARRGSSMKDKPQGQGGVRNSTAPQSRQTTPFQKKMKKRKKRKKKNEEKNNDDNENL